MDTMATGIRLRDIASCFEGVIPSPLCTCSREGVPNVTYLSIVHRVGEDRVALSVQFFNKTRRNVRENPRAQVLLVAPDTMAQYRLDLEYERTDVDGAVFDYVRARLDAVASQSGMSHVFALRGVDIYRVLDCRPIVAEAPAGHGRGGVDHLSGVAGLTARLSACRDLDQLVDTALDGVGPLCGGTHAFLMLRDEDGRRLFTLASRGFEPSGVGSEILIGQGLIGTAAERRMPVRNTNLARDRIFSRALRDEISRAGDEGRLEREIPLPGLAGAQSQLVVPLVAQDGLVGVLCLQSREPGRFLAADEAAVEIVGLSVVLGGRPVLEDVDLRIERNDYLAILGPNGGGKSTLLKLLAGLFVVLGRHQRAVPDAAHPHQREAEPRIRCDDKAAPRPARLLGLVAHVHAAVVPLHGQPDDLARPFHVLPGQRAEHARQGQARRPGRNVGHRRGRAVCIEHREDALEQLALVHLGGRVMAEPDEPPGAERRKHHHLADGRLARRGLEQHGVHARAGQL